MITIRTMRTGMRLVASDKAPDWMKEAGEYELLGWTTKGEQPLFCRNVATGKTGWFRKAHMSAARPAAYPPPLAGDAGTISGP